MRRYVVVLLVVSLAVILAGCTGYQGEGVGNPVGDGVKTMYGDGVSDVAFRAGGGGSGSSGSASRQAQVVLSGRYKSASEPDATMTFRAGKLIFGADGIEFLEVDYYVVGNTLYMTFLGETEGFEFYQVDSDWFIFEGEMFIR